jgi:hypothetical protein
MYPNGAEFAFTLLDDTDDTTLVNGPPVYDVLRDHGLRTTKTVWTYDAPLEQRGIYHAGETLDSPLYLDWVKKLESEGFEIAFHNASMASSNRETTVRALDHLSNTLEKPVRLHCNHGQNKENLFWGAARYQSRPFNALAKMRTGEWRSRHYEGEIPGSPYYWADVANSRLRYIRSMAFRRLNGLEIEPRRPYRDTAKLEQPVFFNTADAPDCEAFNQLVTRETLDDLRRTGGWAIVSTHLGKGFCTRGDVDKRFLKTIEYLAGMRGWYVPASQLLDFLVERDGCAPISSLERMRMETWHVLDRLGY